MSAGVLTCTSAWGCMATSAEGSVYANANHETTLQLRTRGVPETPFN